MARYNTPVKDYKKWLPKGKGVKRAGLQDCTVQQGITIFSRKKKNGCKLVSNQKLRREANAFVKEIIPTVTVPCKAAFPKVPL